MENQKLLDYVRQQLAAGVAKEEIQKALASQGWSEGDISSAFEVPSSLATPSQSSLQAQMPTQNPVGVGKRIVSVIGYLVSFFVSYTVLANILVLGTVAVYFISESENFPSSIFGLEKIVAFIASVFLAWIVGRYFHWTIFGKFERLHAAHGRISRIAFSIFCGVFLLTFILVLTPSTLGLFYRDIPRIDDTDLQLPTLSIPDEQNALTDLTAASKAIDKTYDTQELQDMLGGKSWNPTLAAQAVAANVSALSLYATAASKSVFQDPASAKPDTVSVATVLPSLAPFRTLDRLNGVAALYLAHQGKGVEALQTALVCVAVGDKIEKSQGFLLESLVGVAIKKQALSTINLVLASSTVSTKDLVSFASALKQYTNDGAGLAKAAKVEYYTQKSTIEGIAHG